MAKMMGKNNRFGVCHCWDCNPRKAIKGRATENHEWRKEAQETQTEENET